jgi:hypothetical protein
VFFAFGVVQNTLFGPGSLLSWGRQEALIGINSFTFCPAHASFYRRLASRRRSNPESLLAMTGKQQEKRRQLCPSSTLAIFKASKRTDSSSGEARNFFQFDEQTIEASITNSKIFWPVQNFVVHFQRITKNSGQNDAPPRPLFAFFACKTLYSPA